MRIISLKILREFWETHPDARQAVQAWYHNAKRAAWKTPADIREANRNASFIGSNRIVFNLKGNQYRLVVAIQYQHGIIFIRFIGTHDEYAKINVSSI